MSGAFDFDSFDDTSDIARPKKAFWAIDLDDKDNEKEILSWLNGELNYLKEESRERLRKIKRNLALYRGIQYEAQDVRQDRREEGVNRSRSIPKIVVNHLYDLTQNRVSRLVKYKPAVAVMPTNDEFEDKVSAKLTEALLQHIWYLQKFEGLMTPEIAKIGNICGECFLWVNWGPNLGDYHPDAKPDKNGEFKKVPLLGEDGKPELDSLGNKIMIEKPIRVGDVDYEITMPWDVYLEKKARISDAQYCFRRKVMKVEEARMMYPDAADKIKDQADYEEFDFNTLEVKKLVNEVVIWEFWHRRTTGLPNGRLVAFTKDDIILNTDFPFSHTEHPFERFTDIEIPGQLHALSFFETVKALTSTYNNLTNMIQRNQFLTAHPKWMAPAGSVNIKHLGNDITIVQYKGQVPPQLVQMNPTPAEVFTFRQQLKEEFQQIAGVFGVSRGEPPPGIKAGVALQFLSEQESERFNELILKWNEFIRNVAQKTIAVAGDYYDSSDKRMIRILGKDNSWQTRFFDSANLSKNYDVRVQNSSALPQSKAARMQTLMDLSEKFPDMFTSEQLLDMLDMAQSEKFINAATQAVKSAEAENEQILAGEKTAGVQEYEDHLTHWRIHSRKLQSYSFKEMTPKKIQTVLMDHILVHEMYLYKKAKSNPKLAEQLANESLFPIFFVPESQVPNEQTGVEAQQGGAAPASLAQQPAEGLNPLAGGEAQLPVNIEPEPLDNLPPGEVPPPVEPTGAI